VFAAGRIRNQEVSMEEIDQEVRDELLKAAIDGHIDCGKALAIARNLNIDPGVVGKACNLLQIRVRSCSLGLFD
jgi:pimeloyl-CoA synthetase